eukprot:scaffold29114_cov56-Isochrysis_galbana.AAC.1
MDRPLSAEVRAWRGAGTDGSREIESTHDPSLERERERERGGGGEDDPFTPQPFTRGHARQTIRTGCLMPY